MSCFQQLTRRSSPFQTEEMTSLREHFKRNTYIAQQTELLQGNQGNPTVALQNELEQLEKEFARLIEKHQELQQECAGRWRKVRSDALIYRKVCNSQRNGIGRLWKWLKSLFKRNWGKYKNMKDANTSLKSVKKNLHHRKRTARSCDLILILFLPGYK